MSLLAHLNITKMNIKNTIYFSMCTNIGDRGGCCQDNFEVSRLRGRARHLVFSPPLAKLLFNYKKVFAINRTPSCRIARRETSPAAASCATWRITWARPVPSTVPRTNMRLHSALNEFRRRNKKAQKANSIRGCAGAKLIGACAADGDRGAAKINPSWRSGFKLIPHSRRNPFKLAFI